MKNKLNTTHFSPRGRGFTLIELLVVIAIIAILAAMLTPALVGARKGAQKKMAQVEMGKLSMAIQSYHTDNNIYPCSTAAKNAAASTAGGADDFTYGGTYATPTGNYVVGSLDNREVMAILMDREVDGLGNPTVNAGHVKNPQRNVMSVKTVNDITSPGVGQDLVFRDPWGSPYIITMDFNFDEKARDAFYRMKNVSQQSGVNGYNGLANSIDAGGNGDHFESSSPVMIWSAGPDKRIDPNAKANAGANKDNLLLWKQ
jgi:prepilin-type N-terminal cleavage/methylation domain-containing protein